MVFMITFPDWAKSVLVLPEVPNATAAPAPALSASRLEIVILGPQLLFVRRTAVLSRSRSIGSTAI
jgi:hypothetical protein